MKRNDWVWVFAKAFGIYLLTIAVRSIASVVQYIIACSDGNPSDVSFLVYYVLALIIAVGLGLALLLRTDWMMWFAGARPGNGEDPEGSQEEPAASISGDLESRKNMLWVVVKALGVFLALMAIVKLPATIVQLAEVFSRQAEGYFLWGDRIFYEVLTTYSQLGVGVCLIIFTGFFAKVITKQFGSLSSLKDKLKYAGEVDSDKEGSES